MLFYKYELQAWNCWIIGLIPPLLKGGKGDFVWIDGLNHPALRAPLLV